MFGEALHKGQWNTKKTEALMRKADTNEDGQISVDEWLSMYQPFLDTESFSDGQFEMRLTSFRAAVHKMHCKEVARMGAKVDKLQHQDLSMRSRVEQLRGVFEACDVNADGRVSTVCVCGGGTCM